MDGSYRQCDACGKRALSIATRCPGCGREFADPVVPGSGKRRFRIFLTPRGVGIAIAAGAILASARLGGTTRPADQGVEVAASVPGAGLPDPAAADESPPASAGEYLVARDWTNVRRSRSPRAPLEALLTPGDTVYADSLQRDWYRVALDGEVLGYAHRTTLRASSTTRRPPPR